MAIYTARMGKLQKEIIEKIQEHPSQASYPDILAILLNRSERQVTKACINLIGRGILAVDEMDAVVLTKEAKEALKSA